MIESPPYEALAILLSPFVGSFLGTLVVRLPNNEGVILGRSVCKNCGQSLGIAELVPLASWLMQGGKCRRCSSTIDPIHPIIEAAAVGVAAWAALTQDGASIILTSGLGWLLLAISIIDRRHFIIPDSLTLALALTGVAVVCFLDGGALGERLLSAVVGFVSFAGIGWLYRKIRKRDGLGLGDAKLLAAAGVWTAWIGLPSVVLIGAVTALAVSLSCAVAGRPLELQRQIPFGAYLCLGLWLVWLYGPLQLGSLIFANET